MVKLTKIYTRTGDDGTTGLGTGERVAKDDLRVDAYGDVDEANAALGWAVVACERSRSGDGGAAGGEVARLAQVLRDIQQDMFDLGADLCIPRTPDEQPGSRLRVVPAQTERLEGLIDRYNESLPTLSSFILPGGSEAAAALHIARTVVRRAERKVVALRRNDDVATGAEPQRYLNRLSDLLFVLARVANLGGGPSGPNGGGDVLWVPGANRGKRA